MLDSMEKCGCGHARFYHEAMADRCRATDCYCRKVEQPGEECRIAHAATNGTYRCKSKAGHEGPCPAEPTNLHVCAHRTSPCAICWADTNELERLLDSVTAELVRRGRFTIPSNHR